jgi:hypothetical protein
MPGKVGCFSEKDLENERFRSDVVAYIKAGYLEEVDEGAKDIVYESAKPVVSVIVPKDMPLQEMGQVVLPKGLKQEDEGNVVVTGKLPGQGEVKTISDFVGGQVKKASKVIEDAGKGKEKKSEKKEDKPMPEDLKDWFKLRHAQKKLKILEMTDIVRLKYIMEWDEKVKKLIDQRLKELQ